MTSCDRALALKPDNPEALLNRGVALRDLGRCEEALRSFDGALALRPDNAAALVNRGITLRDLNRAEESLPSFDRALMADSGNAFAHESKGIVLTELGRLDAASASIETAIELAPSRVHCYYSLTLCKRFAPGDRHIRAMAELVRDVSSFGAEDQSFLHFALGKALGDIGDHEASFRCLHTGNAFKRERTVYDEGAVLGGLERMRAAFPRELMNRASDLGDPSAVPVFILGMPRSGITLVEQILASHPAVFGGGEVTHFGDLIVETSGGATTEAHFPQKASSLSGEQLHRLGAAYVDRLTTKARAAKRVTDKLPENFRFIGLIRLALPNARIIHLRRDPVDTCFSCFSKLFSGHLPYTYDLGELGRYYRAYEALMAHWRDVSPKRIMLDVQYEELVADLEGNARRIVAHCGLEWDARCVDFHRTERQVRTASAAQVREPIYKSSVGRWRAYESWLGLLLAELGRTG